MLLRRVGIILIMVTLKAIPLLAQEELRRHALASDLVLSQSYINCICQDRQGFMWFGTQDGLNRYDGNNIIVFKNDPVDSSSISGNSINCIYQDKQNTLWIGTDECLNAYNVYTGKFTNYVHKKKLNGSISANNIYSVFEDKEGNIWAGTIYNQLNKLSKATGQFTKYELSPGDSNENHYITSITEDKYGNIWIGTFGKGLFMLNKKTGDIKNFARSKANGEVLSTPETKINAILYDEPSGNLFIGTDGSGLEVFDINQKTFTYSYLNKSAEDPYPQFITGLTKDSHGNIWVSANTGDGLLSFDKTRGTFFSYKGTGHSSTSVYDNTFNSVYVGNDGIIWTGGNNGITYYVPQKRNFVNYSDTNYPDFKVVMALGRDAEGKLWIGTNGGGLYSYEESSKTFNHNITLNQVLKNQSVLSLYTDKKGILWIGTWGAGVYGYNPLTEKTFFPDSLNQVLAQSTLTAVIEDHRGKLWFGTYGEGIFIYDEKAGTVEQFNVSLSSKNIYCFHEDKEKNMWIGTDGGGINVYNIDDGKNAVIEKTAGKNTLSSNSVNCFYEDGKGAMWIGTAAGLNKYVLSEHKFTNFFERDGLPNNYVYTILPDNEGNLWLSTNKGLSKFNPEISNEDGRAFKNYDKTDGLAANEFNQGACLKGPDGRLFFGSTNGVVSFHPEKVVGNTHIPPVYITSCEVFGKEYASDTLISSEKSLEFLWKYNTLSFSFAGLDYQVPSKNRYSYMLEGLDKDWSVPSTRHFASYAQLPPGNYILHVRACNNDGAWNFVGANISIHIIPPFWKTTWFYIICIIMGTGCVIGYTQYRTFRIQKEKRILEAKVDERTHELAQRTRELAEKNHDITSSIEYAKRIQQAILPPIEEIKKHLPESFILYKPKDIVSGDFYWFGEKNGKAIIAAADCTGHGVPGALMSMIGHNLLNQIVMEQGITQPDIILNNLNTLVQKVLKQGISTIDTTDGMDIALCCIDKSSGELQYAGAYRPLLIVTAGEVAKVEADKKPIGGSQMGMERSFKNNILKVQKNSTVYMFSDGYADQFGGPEMKKYMLKNFISKILNISNLTMPEQEKKLHESLLSWQGNNEQVDDILVIGIHFS